MFLMIRAIRKVYSLLSENTFEQHEQPEPADWTKKLRILDIVNPTYRQGYKWTSYSYRNTPTKIEIKKSEREVFSMWMRQEDK
jgi:hypothetical protein